MVQETKVQNMHSISIRTNLKKYQRTSRNTFCSCLNRPTRLSTINIKWILTLQWWLQCLPVCRAYLVPCTLPCIIRWPRCPMQAGRWVTANHQMLKAADIWMKPWECSSRCIFTITRYIRMATTLWWILRWVEWIASWILTQMATDWCQAKIRGWAQALMVLCPMGKWIRWPGIRCLKYLLLKFLPSHQQTRMQVKLQTTWQMLQLLSSKN